MAQPVEQMRTEACAFDGLRGLPGQDGVGIHVGAWHRRGKAAVAGERFHGVTASIAVPWP